MVSVIVVKSMIEKLPDVELQDFFGVGACVANDRIFAIIWYNNKIANLRLSPLDQKYFLSKTSDGFVSPGISLKKRGFVRVKLDTAKRSSFEKALKKACECAVN